MDPGAKWDLPRPQLQQGSLFSTSGFVDFLFDRKTEEEKECTEWKFAIVASAYKNGTSKVLLGDTVVERMETFLTQASERGGLRLVGPPCARAQRHYPPARAGD